MYPGDNIYLEHNMWNSKGFMRDVLGINVRAYPKPATHTHTHTFKELSELKLLTETDVLINGCR